MVWDLNNIHFFISSTIEENCKKSGISKYSEEISAKLTELAKENIQKTLKTETMRFTRTLSRSARAELPKSSLLQTEQSISRVIKTAAIKAKERGDDSIKLTDVEASINELWCSIWPFCSPRD